MTFSVISEFVRRWRRQLKQRGDLYTHLSLSLRHNDTPDGRKFERTYAIVVIHNRRFEIAVGYRAAIGADRA